MLVDLHMHSNASDGQYSPIELVEKAKAVGLEYMALTDHDTINGLDKAIKKGQEISLNVIRGVELSAKEHKNMHILGLNFSKDCYSLMQICDEMKVNRNERKYRIIDFLKEKGVDILLEDVEKLANNSNIGRPHFAQIMLKCGYVKSIREAFDKYLDTDEYQKLEKFKPSVQVCIEAIHRSGGMAVLAHPYQLNLDDDQLENTVANLKNYGLDGIEVYYSKHTPDMIKKYIYLAKKYNLNITAGSDFHGEKIKPDVRIIPFSLDIGWLY